MTLDFGVTRASLRDPQPAKPWNTFTIQTSANLLPQNLLFISMSMSTHVVGYRPADETWNRMKTIWNTCYAADVPVPTKVLEFFDHEPPGDKPGAEVQIDKATKPYKSEFSEGYEVNLSLLPKDVNVIRFYNSH